MSERLRREYVGRAGHLAAMSELLWRGYNVAVPEVDRGDDIFVVHDLDGTLSRVQVKTATGRPYRTGRGCRAEFSIGFRQLARARQPDLNYVFVVRHDDRWSNWVLASRPELFLLHRRDGVGRRAGDNVIFSLGLRPDAVLGNGVDLTAHRDAWDRYWPPLI